MTLSERRRQINALRRINERKRRLSALNDNIKRIKLSELKRIIKQEVLKMKLMKEQGRPKLEGGQYYETDEFIDYIRAGLKSGRGRPQEFEVEIGEDFVTLSDKELLDAYDPSGKWYDVYGKDGEALAKVPLDLESLE